MIQHLSGLNKAAELLWAISLDQLIQGMEAGQQGESLQPAMSFCLLANLITGYCIPEGEEEDAITLINKKTSKER